MYLPFQNEYLFASLVEPDLPNNKLDAGAQSGNRRLPEGEVIAMVPDLISLVGSDGYALGTQDLRYGVRVSVVSFVAHPHWYTEKGIAIGGPREFGYYMDLQPLGSAYYEPKRVTAEFREQMPQSPSSRCAYTPGTSSPIRISNQDIQSCFMFPL